MSCVAVFWEESHCHGYNMSSNVKHMQYNTPLINKNWATDSVCCTVKECGRSRVQHTARFATVTSQLNTK